MLYLDSTMRPLICMQGLQSSNTEQSSWCQEALLSCNALLHPRQTTPISPAEARSGPSLAEALQQLQELLSQGAAVPSGGDKPGS